MDNARPYFRYDDAAVSKNSSLPEVDHGTPKSLTEYLDRIKPIDISSRQLEILKNAENHSRSCKAIIIGTFSDQRILW